MSVSGELLCSFELLKPLDSSALKNHIKKGRKERQNMLNSPVSFCCFTYALLRQRLMHIITARTVCSAKLLVLGWRRTRRSSAGRLLFIRL